MKRSFKRAVASLMAFLMAFGLIPFTMFNGGMIQAKAADKTYTLDVATDMADIAKGGAVEGTFGDYFTVSGSVTKKAATYVELAKNSGGKIGFTVSEGCTAAISFVATSTGPDNTSKMALMLSGAEVVEDEGITGASGQDGTTFTYTDCEAGEYSIVCNDTGRGGRIISVQVVEKSASDSEPSAEPSEEPSADPVETTVVPEESEDPSETTVVPVVSEEPTETTVVPEESEEPAETTLVPVVSEEPAETTLVPVETTLVPVETTLVPVVSEEPAETTLVPVETTLVPVETTLVPVETTTVPAETTTVPVETTLVPVETTLVPVETTTVPAETTTVPAETTTVPAETTTVPVETTLVPVETTGVPTEVPTAVPTAMPTVAPVLSTVPDVWDFGAEVVEGANNNYTVEFNNSIYPGVEAGTKGKNLVSFTAKDGAGVDALKFNDGGYTTSHRFRSTNTKLTRYDDKSLTGDDKHTYTGYIYSNKSSDKNVNLQFYLYAGDKLVCMLGSNGNAAVYEMVSPSGATETFDYSGASKLETATFYAAETGWYTLWCTNEKLVCGRVTRTHNPYVTVSGSVDEPVIVVTAVPNEDGGSQYQYEDMPEGYKLVFTNDTTGAVTKEAPVDKEYSVKLNSNYTYTVSLEGANEYVVSEGSSIEVGAEDTTNDIKIEKVDLTFVRGEIVGLNEEAISKLKLSFVSSNVYVPSISISEDGGYSVTVEPNVEYTLVAEDVNDYELKTTTMLVTYGGYVEIIFEKKPTYAITINPVGATLEDLSGATFTFTNLNEEGYVYSFTGTEGIELRDGVYSVEVTDIGALVQKLTANLTVNGAAVTKTINFDSDVKKWTFTDADFTSGKYSAGGEFSYNGLVVSGGKEHQKTYLYMGAGKVSVPVKGNCTVKVSTCYQYSFYFENDTEASVGVKTESTSKIDTFSYDYKGDAGFVDITFLGTSYVNVIEVVYSEPYRDVVYVGADKEYQTINAALAAIRKMDRDASQSVTIMIDPGDYEEMLVIDTPNVTLKNASLTPSIELKNKGVDIDANAVRITSYYGHGYSYYSMGPDCKYDAELLAVNKENGYESFTNPGSGTTAGSYWNATVVIKASNVSADGIIFENSFNQYISKKAAEDVIVKQSGAKEGSVARADMKAGDTTVQNKKYVERAAALAITDNNKDVYFYNCKFVGRQDTLFGGTSTVAAFDACSIYGGTDYIMGPMTAVFYRCDLVFNTMEDSNDVGYITAAQQKSGRGYLMYKCHVTSTVPGVDTASEKTSKPGYFGRPWAADTGEAVFYKTIIDASYDGESLIVPAGWLSTLSAESVLSQEYGTIEKAGVDNSSKRASWASVLTEEKLVDGKDITIATFLGEWDPIQYTEDPVDPIGMEPTLIDEEGVLKYYDKGAFDATFTSLFYFEGVWYNVVNGIVDTNYAGLVNFGGTWFYVSNGVLDVDYAGLTFYDGVWYFVTNGMIDTVYAGLTFYNGAWYYVSNGVLDTVYAGLTYYEGTWYYVANGILDVYYVGLTYFNGGWYYVAEGQVNWAYVGLVDYAGVLYFVNGGILDASVSGVNNINGVWYYLENGAVASWYTSLAQYNGVWFYVNAGVLDFTYTGLVYFDGIWFYVTEGVLDTVYAGLTNFGGVWYYVSNGMLDTVYAGLTNFGGVWYYVSNGVLDVYYVGLTYYGGAWFYVAGGQVDWNYTGTCMYDGVNYMVEAGVLTGFAM